MHAQIHSVPRLIPCCISLLPGSPGLPHESHIAAVVLHSLLCVLQAEGVLGGFQHMLLELAQHIWLLPNSRPLVAAPFAEGLGNSLDISQDCAAYIQRGQQVCSCQTLFKWASGKVPKPGGMPQSRLALLVSGCPGNAAVSKNKAWNG